MKLATIQDEGRPIIAVIDPERSVWWPLSQIVSDLPERAGGDMAAAIASIGTRAGSAPSATGGRTLDRTQLLAPIPAPGHNIMCVGKNYRAHAQEFTRSGFDAGAIAAEAVPEHPIIFTKPATSISGPYDDIPLWPGLDQGVDYEAELAVVIGRGGRFIRRENAFDHVFGYTIINDVTARDLQRIHKQWFLGKAVDGFCPMGPWIVTADELDPARLDVSSRINGELRQKANTADLIFDVPTLIEVISRSVTLSPGDVIATGTPEGVGIGFDPPRFLKDGDLVEISISGIGTIRNTVRRKQAGQNVDEPRAAAAAE